MILHIECNWILWFAVCTVWNICEILLCCGDLRCFVVKQFSSQIYALLKKGQISGMSSYVTQNNFSICLCLQVTGGGEGMWIWRLKASSTPCRIHFIDCATVSAQPMTSFDSKLNLWSWKVTRWGRKVAASIQDLILSPKEKILVQHWSDATMVWYGDGMVPSTKLSVIAFEEMQLD